MKTASMAFAAGLICAPAALADVSLPTGLPTIQVTQAMETAAHEAVKGELKDPYSARFHDLKAFNYAIADYPTVQVCGFVNAKNSYGAYAGKVPFRAVLIGSEDNGFSGLDAQLADNDKHGIAAFYQVFPGCL